MQEDNRLCIRRCWVASFQSTRCHHEFGKQRVHAILGCHTANRLQHRLEPMPHAVTSFCTDVQDWFLSKRQSSVVLKFTVSNGVCEKDVYLMYVFVCPQYGMLADTCL